MAPIIIRGDRSRHHKCIGAVGIATGMRTHMCATRKYFGMRMHISIRTM